MIVKSRMGTRHGPPQQLVGKREWGETARLFLELRVQRAPLSSVWHPLSTALFTHVIRPPQGLKLTICLSTQKTLYWPCAVSCEQSRNYIWELHFPEFLYGSRSRPAIREICRRFGRWNEAMAIGFRRSGVGTRCGSSSHTVTALLAHLSAADISWVHSRSRSNQISPSLSKPWAGYTFSSVTTGTRFSCASPVGSSLEAVRVRGTFQFVPVLSHFTSNFCPTCRPCWSAEDLGPTPDTEATALHRLCHCFSYSVNLISIVSPLFCVTQNSCVVPDPMLTNTTDYSHGLSKRKDLLFLLPCGSSEQLFLPASAFLIELWSLSPPPPTPTPLSWSPSWPLPNHRHHYQNHDYHHHFHCHHHHQNQRYHCSHLLPPPQPSLWPYLPEFFHTNRCIQIIPILQMWSWGPERLSNMERFKPRSSPSPLFHHSTAQPLGLCLTEEGTGQRSKKDRKKRNCADQERSTQRNSS